MSFFLSFNKFLTIGVKNNLNVDRCSIFTFVKHTSDKVSTGTFYLWIFLKKLVHFGVQKVNLQFT